MGPASLFPRVEVSKGNVLVKTFFLVMCSLTQSELYPQFMFAEQTLDRASEAETEAVSASSEGQGVWGEP